MKRVPANEIHYVLSTYADVHNRFFLATKREEQIRWAGALDRLEKYIIWLTQN